LHKIHTNDRQPTHPDDTFGLSIHSTLEALMQGPSILQALSRHLGTRRSRPLDFLLVLLGAALAYWLAPGLVEGPGF